MSIAERSSSAISVSSLKRGDILVWKNYKFSDGTQKTKRVLLLSDCIDGKAIIVVLPTSQLQYYVNDLNQTAMMDTICFLANESASFEKDTVIDLKNIDILRVSNVEAVSHRGGVFQRDSLDEKSMAKILDVVRIAKTLTPRLKKYILDS